MALLTEDQINEGLAKLDGWNQDGSAITKVYEKGDFTGSVRFAGAIVGPAEELGHHPDLEISWSTVRVSISTHSEGGLTEKDFELAGKLDELE